MKGRIRSKLTFSNVLAGIALLVAMSTGTAYAAAQINGANIINGTVRGIKLTDGTVQSVDIQNNQLNSGDVRDNTLKTQDVLDGTLRSIDILNDSITADDLATGSVGQLEIQTDGVAATEIADNTIDSGEIVDFGLTNEDTGVLEAQVNANGTLASSDHVGTTSSSLGTGTYEVDFARSVANCTPVVTQGEAGVGGAGGAITGVTDRSGNVEAFFVTTRSTANALVNTAFHIVVVC